MTPQHADPLRFPIYGPLRRRFYALYCWAIVILILFSFGLLIIAWPGPRSQRRLIARTGARALFWLTGIPVVAVGMRRLPEGRHILVANHTSFLDALILTAALPANPGYAFVARQEFRSQILLWPLLRALGTVILHEHTTAEPSNIGRLQSALEDAQNLVVFPEGGIQRSPGVQPFHTGAFFAAGQLGVSIVLAGIAGARQALPLKTWQPIRTRIVVTIGDVIEPAGTNEEVVLRNISSARERMAALAGEELVSSMLREP